MSTARTELTPQQLGPALSLDFHHRRALFDDHNRVVERWEVNARLADSDDLDREDVVGRIEILRSRLGHPDLWPFLDDEMAYLDYLPHAIIDPGTGELRDTIRRRLLGFGNHMLVLTAASIDADLAGRRVGRWLTAEAIETLGGDATAVLARADTWDESTGQLRERRNLKIRRVWESIGFVHLGENILLLDLSHTGFEERLCRLRADFNTT